VIGTVSQHDERVRPEGVFKALADRTRVRILQLLCRQELNVSELVEVLQQPQPTISRHLKVLGTQGLVTARTVGTAAFYSVSADLTNGQGEGGPKGLAAQAVDWVKAEDMPGSIEEQLDAVLADRGHKGGSFFARQAHRWDEMRIGCFGESFPFEAMWRLLPSDWTVVDIGSGTGYLVGALANVFEQVIAVEPVEEMINLASDRPEVKGRENVEFRQGDLSKLPLGRQEVDLAIAALVLHHVEDIRTGLEEIRRVLKTGGRLLIIEQREHDLKEFRRRMGDYWMGFEPTELAAFLKAAGFVDIEVHDLTSVGRRSGRAPEAPGLFTMTARRG
jgi:ArsR family transcriptional regulator